jgi:hypothetical protein
MKIFSKKFPASFRQRGSLWAQHEWNVRRCSNSLCGDYGGDDGSTPPPKND